MKKQIIFIFVIAASIFSGPLRAQTVHTSTGSSVIVLDNVDNNFWENVPLSEVLDPFLGSTNWSSGPTSGEVDAFNITFSASSGAAFNSLIDQPTGVTCGSGTGFVAGKGKGAKPLAIDSLPTGCQLIFNEANAYDNNRAWQMCYDTAKELVEQCTFYYPDVISGFEFMTHAATALGNTGQRRSDYYAWLKSVLYLNTVNPEYFCSCVEALAGEIPVPHHIYPDTGYDWVLAIQNWLIQNTSCDSASLRGIYNRTRETQRETWQNDPSQYKLDTTLPPLDSIEPGLQELLEKHLLYADVPENFHGILSNASANPNPTGNGTVISFGISKEAYVKIELFDLLGHEVSSAGYESLFEPGNKSVPLLLAGLPSGTYYARIMSAYGEVQTVKLVKE